MVLFMLIGVDIFLLGTKKQRCLWAEMNFKTTNLKKSYDSDSDSILGDFYIPVLSNAVIYRRLAGFFSSSSLAVAAKGITDFISNGGKIQLITGAILQKADIDAIENADNNFEKSISSPMMEDLENLEEGFVKDHVGALGWMIANKRLKIKIAILTKEDKGIFHQKVGILEDGEGNKLSFSGSDNESAAAWEDNIEEFKIFREWVDNEKEYFEADEKKFNKFWSGLASKVRVIDAPEAIRQKLIEVAPKDIRKLDLKKYYSSKKSFPKQGTISLRSYQKEAIKEWLRNKNKGIFEMATGTGKTMAAIGCIERIIKDKEDILCIISAPYNHLVAQWKKELNKIINLNISEFSGLAGLSKNNQITVGGSQSGWKKILSNKLLDLENGLTNRLFIFTTHATLSSDFFVTKINNTNNIQDTVVIVDEVHGIGALKMRNGLLNKYTYRLGLSATPERWFDDEGTKTIIDYFSKTVYEFPISRAIKEVNPDTGKTYLTPYDYYPYEVYLTDEESEKYIDLSKKISKLFKYKSDDKKYNERFDLLEIQRANILKSSKNKINTLKRILNDCNLRHGELKHVIIYCNPGEQFEEVQDLLLDSKIKYHPFTSKEGVRPERKYQGMSEREKIISDFVFGHFQVLVAMRCLDEGIDIPSAKVGIIMASSTNPKEFIQRRGRLLRHSENKRKSYIYDTIVLPPNTSNVNKGFLCKYEKNIARKEIQRYKEFSGIADNSADCLIKLIEIENKLGFI